MTVYNEIGTGGASGNGQSVVSAQYNPNIGGGAGANGSSILRFVMNSFMTGGASANGFYLLAFHYAADTSQPIIINGSASIRASYFFPQRFRWFDRIIISTRKNFIWNDGLQPKRWFRVTGCCQFPTSRGDGLAPGGGTSSQVGGCDVIPFQSNDSQCTGALGKNQFIQNIVASDISEVCEVLTAQNWRWPICSIAVFSRPADNSFVDPTDTCNILSDVTAEFCTIPACLDFCLKSDAIEKMAMRATVSINYFRYVGSGGVDIGGNAVVDLISGTAVGPGFEYLGEGGAIVEGSAEYRVVSYNIGYESKMAMVGEIKDIEIIYSPQDHALQLSTPTDTVFAGCGNCTTMPLILHLKHNLDQAAVLLDFVTRNGFTIPTDILMYHSQRYGSWQATLHYTGISDDNQSSNETWRLLFEWACVNTLASQDLGNNIWKFSISILRRNLITNLDFDTRLLVVFPTDQICPLNTTGFNFGFNFDTQKVTVNTNLDIVVDVRLLYDNIGLFKSQFWVDNPLLSIQITQSQQQVNYRTLDIHPIFPVEPLLV